jgi:hypothetical protein
VAPELHASAGIAIAVGKFKRCESRGIDTIPTEIMQSVGVRICS